MGKAGAVRRFAVLLAAAALLTSGCRFGPSRPCSTDAECGADVCDVELGACRVVRVDVDGGETCDPTCAAHQECVSQTCAPRFSAVVITAPQSGARVKPSAAVQVTASLTVVTGRTAQLPQNLTLRVRSPGGSTSDVTLNQSGGTFAGTWTAAAQSGDYELTAHFTEAGLSSITVTVTVDADAPVLTVAIAPPPSRLPTDGGTTYVDPALPDGGAFRRDEALDLRVSSTATDIDASSVTVAATIAGGAPRSLSVVAEPLSVCGTSSGYCGRIALNLWEVPMAVARGQLALSVSARDSAGNDASAQTTVDVTRWKWMNSVAGTALIGTPVLDPTGNLYLGYSTAASGWVRSLDSDGRVRWIRTGTGAVASSPAVGNADGGVVLLVGEQSGGNSNLLALDARDGGVITSCGPYSGTIRGAIAVTETSFTDARETAFGHVSGNGGRLIALRVGAPSGEDCVTRSGVGAMPTDPTSIVTQSSRAYFGDSLGQVGGFEFNAGNINALPNFPADAGLFTRALAIHGSRLVGGGGGPGRGGLFSIEPTGGPPTWELKTNAPAWSPAIADGGLAIVGLDGPSILVATVGGDGGTVTAPADVVRGAPVIGEGGWVYLPSVDGTVAARRVGGLGSTAWSLTGLSQLEPSATLDCARDSNGAARPGVPGTLYLAASTGEIYAIIVESRGLDPSAPWPKYQHDAQNSGNPARAMAACP